MGKAKLIDRRLVKPSVRRCLFGRPNNSDGFSELQKRLEEEEAERFKLRWDLHGVENEIEWGRVNQDSIPQFYLRGYEPSRTKPKIRCVGKSLSFDNEDDDDDVKTPTKPMQTSVEVFVFQSPMHEHITPQRKSDCDDHEDSHQHNTKSDSTTTTDTTPDTTNSAVSQTENVLRKKLKQKRLTEMYRVVKKRLGTESSSSGVQKRRKLVDRL